MTWRTQRIQMAGGAGMALILGLLLLPGCSGDAAEPPTSGAGEAPVLIPAEVVLEWTRVKEAHEAILGITQDDSPVRAEGQKVLSGLEERFRKLVEARSCQEEFGEELRMEILESGTKLQTDPRARPRALWLLGILMSLEGDGAFEIYKDLFLDPNIIIPIRRHAANSMGRMDCEAGASVFMTFLRKSADAKSDWPMKLLDVLKRYHYPKVIEFILVGLELSENDHVLTRLAAAAAKHPDARLLSILKNLALRATSPFVRVNASLTLGIHVGGPSMPFLQSLYDNIPADAIPADRVVLEKGFLRALQTTRYQGPGPLAASWR